jgi:RTX calcium-binding nonapeptide repeat (4 copies)
LIGVRPLPATVAAGLVWLFALLPAASAATISGTSGPDRLAGTRGADLIFGRGGGDRLSGLAGGDFLHGGAGRDRIDAGAGDDRVAVQTDGSRDSVACGTGRDVVNADLEDAVARDCEIVSRQLSQDPYRNPDSQHETAAEPDSFSFGSTIVTAYQVGRAFEGGASNIGFSTSSDGGRTWRSGYLPSLTIYAQPAGRFERASDPVVAYDAAHGVWLIASLAFSPTTELLISRSSDGLSWSAPVAASSATSSSLAYDKEWITCDNWPGSPFRGRCYLSFTDVFGRRLATQTSTDGGRTWSPAVPGSATPVTGAQPVVRPNGELIVAFLEPSGISTVSSSDGGGTFGTPTRIFELFDADVPWFRAPPLPSIDVDASGRIYLAWHDCRFRVGCRANDIVVASTGDGVAWTGPTRVPLAPLSSVATYFVPGLGADPAATAGPARLAIAYHLYPTAGCSPSSCRVDVGLVTSADGGASWGPPQRLNAQSMPLAWIADTGAGRMLGDYVSTSFVGATPIPVVAFASEPAGPTRFKQAIFATVPPR